MDRKRRRRTGPGGSADDRGVEARRAKIDVSSLGSEIAVETVAEIAFPAGIRVVQRSARRHEPIVDKKALLDLGGKACRFMSSSSVLRRYAGSTSLSTAVKVLLSAYRRSLAL